jgi:hypothetical protein
MFLEGFLENLAVRRGDGFPSRAGETKQFGGVVADSIGKRTCRKVVAVETERS